MREPFDVVTRTVPETLRVEPSMVEDLLQRHAEGGEPSATAGAEEDAFAGQHQQTHLPGVPPVHHPQHCLGVSQG